MYSTERSKQMYISRIDGNTINNTKVKLKKNMRETLAR